MQIMRKAVAALAVLAWSALPVFAQEEPWANKLFRSKGSISHDFGTVPQGTQLKYRFNLKNIYKVPLEITHVGVSCGCVEIRDYSRIVQPNEEGYVDINMDTRRINNGFRTVRIFITVGPKYVSTATLQVSAAVRTDVVFNPESINFGLVPRGQTPTRTLDVEYMGGQNWQVTEIIKSASAPFELRADTLAADTGGFRRASRVGYRLTVTLKPNAPPGPFRQELILKTNDSSSPSLTVTVEGSIQASLQVSRKNNLGTIKVGEKRERKVLVEGSRPFRILAVDGQGDGLIVVAKGASTSAAAHTLTIRFEPTKQGPVRRELIIRTDLDNQSAIMTVEANVVR
jgi:uncharacterized protein DUF1573